MINFLIVLAMGVLSRACGGWFKLFGENYVYALPYFIPVFVMTQQHGVSSYILCAVAVAFAGAAKGLGHGRGISLDVPDRLIGEPEKVEKLISWLQPKMSVFKYKVLILSVTGLAVALVPALICGYFNVGAGVALALGGLAKGPAYVVGLKLKPFLHVMPSGLRKFTEIGEFLTGVAAGLSIVLFL